MSAKVGQWVRKGRHIGVVTKVYVGGYDIQCNTLRRPFNYVDSLYYEEWKVANTPQELVQEEDFVELSKSYLGQNFLKVEKYFNLNDDVITIYTPNSDKSQYTLQWRKE